MDIVENNKLLAEFVGFKKISNFYNSQDILHNIEQDTNWFSEDLKFNSDWNWLMQVVEKILNTALELDEMEMYYKITDNMPRIDHTYEACVDFVKWYNKIK